MEIDILLINLIVVTLVVIILGFPISFCLGAGAVFYLIANDFPLSQAVSKLAFSVQSYTMLAIPLFMLTGRLMNESKITDRIFDFANMLIGRIPGGLGHVNVVLSLMFSGMSGSALADVGGIGAMELKAMKDRGYDEDFSVGITLASSVIGPIFPPSVPMVLFGIIAEVSITGLFLGGMLPGILITLMLMVYIFFVARRKKYYITETYTFKQFVSAFLRAFPALLTPLIIVGGMTLGIFSPTEAATVSVLYAILLSFIYRELNFKTLWKVLEEVTISISKLMFIIANALLFGWVLTVGELTHQLSSVLTTAFDSPYMFLLLLNITLLILGAIIENAILLYILAPMIAPIAQQVFGIDPIHLGVVMVFNIMIGQFTPPMGLSLFLMKDITGHSLGRISKAVLPFLVPLIISLFIITYIPIIVTFIPRALGF